MEAVKSLEAAVKNSPAYGARNGQKVTAGTGETLPGPDSRVAAGATDPITGDHREVGTVPEGSRRGP